VSDAELSLIPVEARAYQGTAAGIATRTVANSIDALVIALAVLGTYAGISVFRFVVEPRDFEFPDPSLFWWVLGYFELLVIYLTAAWWISGRTVGDRVMGIRVVTGKRSRLRFTRALVRALFCALVPVGLIWCAVDRDRRALHDLVLRTSVIYDWLPRPPSPRRREDKAPAPSDDGSSDEMRSS
jgi:uncharacterized RDD family membrane protein YckC